MEAPMKKFPLNANDYKLYEEIGEGVSASVYRALCLPLNEVVAIKVLDLEKCNNDLDGIRREVQTMSLIDHPNLIRAYGSFITGHTLWVVMPYMGGGSCLHIMKSSFPEGFEEPVIATLLTQVLKALVYLHAHGHIHRDVKAGNILADYNGSIKLADFGVSACMFDAGDRQRSRNTFVGTPCWMAPEVMQPLNGYDFKADVWSFGITALELAHGHAPFSKYPPMKVLLMTLQNAPPGLDYERDKKFSKAFKDMVATCLVKDPKKRPSSEKLLKHPFFKHAKTCDYLERKILDNISPLGDRFRMLKAKEADLLVLNKDLYGDKEHLSQKEYIKGISEWNFNLEDLKNQAALIKDYDDISNVEDTKSSEQQYGINGVTMPATKLSPVIYNNNKNNNNINYNNHSDDKSHDTADESGSLLPENIVYPKKVLTNGERDHHQPRFQVERNYSGPLQHLHKNNMTNSLSVEDFSEGPMVQHKGRFKITNADFSPKGPVLNLSSGGITSPLTSTIPMENVERGNSDSSQMSPSATERELRSEVIQLRQSVGSLVEQLQRQKMENAQLEKKYSDLVKKIGIKE